MTSGNFTTLEISSILINRPERQRRELTNLQELADSIRKTGLIHPPVVTRDRVLVAGERRLTACRDLLGWSHISVQFTDTMDEAELHLIELEENVKRVDLDWKDQCRAMAEYHEVRKKLDPAWTAISTAKALGVTEAELSNRRMVAKALEAGEPLVASADKYSVALGVTRRKDERRKASESERLGAMIAPSVQSPTHTDLMVAPEGLDTFLAEHPLPAEVPVPFLNCEFADFVATYSGTKFNFLHCDFPYGVNAEAHNMGAGAAHGTYDDSEAVYWQLLDTLSEAMQNVVSDSAHMMFWFSMDFYHLTKLRLEAMGWTVNPFPLVWHKSDNSGILPDYRRGPRRIYETAFLCSRGDRFIIQAVANTFAFPNVKTIHMSEKPIDMLRHFFRMFVDENSTVLDPTMGSGNSIRAAILAGAASALGIERDQEFFSLACDAYRAGLTSDAEPV
jgi:hypothetical protein